MRVDFSLFCLTGYCSFSGALGCPPATAMLKLQALRRAALAPGFAVSLSLKWAEILLRVVRFVFLSHPFKRYENLLCSHLRYTLNSVRNDKIV